MKSPHFPALTTHRLRLRQAKQTDDEVVFFLRSDPQVNHYINRKRPRDLQDAAAFIQTINQGIERKEIFYWAINLHASPHMIGSICLWHFSPEADIAEVGYDLLPAYQRQGIMTEALQAVMDFGFKKLRLKEIEAYTHYQNEASKKLLAKNGFRWVPGKKDPRNANNDVFALENADKINQ